MKLIYAANLHKGGSVQVAASFICEIAQLDIAKNYDLVLSSRVKEDLIDPDATLVRFASYQIINHYGISFKAIWFSLFSLQYSRIFVVFGPKYFIAPFAKCMCGFAQPWIIYPQNLVSNGIPVFNLLGIRLKYWIQKWLFYRCQLLVVELPHVKEGLVKLNYPRNRIIIVENCISRVFRESWRWQKIDKYSPQTKYRIGVIGRNYLHKNIDFIGQVGVVLSNISTIEFKFVVTLTEQEYESLSPESRLFSYSIGEINIAQCPEFYKIVDCIFIPSLLECFSATPIEAMFMGKPVVISDLSFNRDICGNCGFYFDPIDPQSAAKQIIEVYNNHTVVSEKVEAGKRIAEKYIDSRGRAIKYIDSFETL